MPPTVVVEVGYNDPAATFATEVDHAMSALTAAGATHVLWLTMRESKAPYPTLNALLAKAETRWPQLELVDWNAASESHSQWFQTDDIHLTPEGGLAMAHLAHAAVMKTRRPAPACVRRRFACRRGVRMRMKLQVQGGTPSYRWRVASGRPPRGFHLLANGTLTTAASVARATMTLAVTDADGTTASLHVLER